MKTELKTINRKLRLVRLNALVGAYSSFMQMELHRSLMYYKNDWHEAEKTRDLIHLLFPDREVGIEQFLYSRDDLSEKALKYYGEFKSLLPVLELSGIPEATVRSFCKNVDKTHSVWMLAGTGHLHYPLWLDALYGYLDGTLSKREMKDRLVEYSLFTGKSSPADMRLFRRSIIRIEALLDEIMTKQSSRRGMTVIEFSNAAKMKGLEAAPF